MVASFSRVVAPSDGAANGKSARLLAPVKPKFVPQMQHQRRFLFFYLSCSASESGNPLLDFDSPTKLYNNNEACVKWSYNMTSKAAHHLKLQENSIYDWIKDKTLNIHSVAGQVNPTNIFT
jgi:hypothetical protein